MAWGVNIATANEEAGTYSNTFLTTILYNKHKSAITAYFMQFYEGEIQITCGSFTPVPHKPLRILPSCEIYDLFMK